MFNKIPVILTMLVIFVGITYLAISLNLVRIEFAGVVESNTRDTNSDDDEVPKENEIDAVAAKQNLVQGDLQVRIEKNIQKLAGIETAIVEETDIISEERAFARVLDIQGLLKLRSDYKKIEAQREIRKTVLANLQATLKRLEQVKKETTNISLRELHLARSKWEEALGELNALNTELNNLRERMSQYWNKELTMMALEDNNDLFERLTRHDDCLILLSLRKNQILPENKGAIFVSQIGDRSNAKEAYYISKAPFTDSRFMGETYFYQTVSNDFRMGMRLHVWLPDKAMRRRGNIVPVEAIIWYTGKPWAYVQIEDEIYSRRSLKELIQTEDYWIVDDNFSVGDKVVVSGAQTLLSEEFKYAIPNEDDD